MFGNDEGNKLAKCGTQEDHIRVTPFHLIGHKKIPYGPPKPSHPSTMMAPLITSNATFKMEHLIAHISSGENISPDISKWITDIDIHPQLFNLLWDSRSTSEAQITQTRKLLNGKVTSNYHNCKFWLYSPHSTLVLPQPKLHMSPITILLYQ